MSVWNNFISPRENLPEIISNLLQKITAAHEYFFMSNVAEIILKLFQNNFMSHVGLTTV